MKTFVLPIPIILICGAFKCYSQTPVWTKGEIGGNIMELSKNRISACTNGDTYVIASFSSQVTVGNYTLTDNGYEAGYFSKYSSAGSVIWSKKIPSSYFAYANALSSDDQDNVYVTGRYYDDVTFGAITLTLTGSSGAIFVAKHDPNGNVIWAKSFPASANFLEVQSIKNDSLKNTYFTGWFEGPIVFGTTTVNSTIGNFFVVKLDSLGNVLWANKYGGTTAATGADIA